MKSGIIILVVLALLILAGPCFFFTVHQTEYAVVTRFGKPVRICTEPGLQFSPLVALATLLANGTLFKGLLWSLVILIPTIFIGRFFCGWVCPLGTLNHWVSEIKSESFARRGKGKIKSNEYKKYQRIKYYILLIFLGAALIGTVQVGLLDPLSFLARSIGTVVLPTVHERD